jgi:hypothetical protein
MSAMDSNWNLINLTKEAISATLRNIHNNFDPDLWDDIGSMLANAERGVYLQAGDAIAPYVGADPERPRSFKLFPGYVYKIVKRKDKQKWDVYKKVGSDQELIQTLMTERGAWKWVKERAGEGFYQVVHLGITGWNHNVQLVTDRDYAHSFMNEVFRQYLPSTAYTNLVHRLNRCFYD